MDRPRLAAYDVLRAVDERSAYANLVLPGLLRDRGISGRDAAFATELAYGTLRGLGTYDAVIAACSSRAPADLDAEVRDVLRLGTHQLLAMRVPAHAAVSSAVELASQVAGRRTAGFTNAVLRAVSARDFAGWMTAVAPAYDVDPVGHIAMVHMHPRWIVEVFAAALDGDLEEVTRACAADNVAAQVHLVARPGRISREDLLASAGAQARPGPWSPHAVHLGPGDPGAIPAVRTGQAGVQDEGSQLAALALIDADVEGPDSWWLDMCAGPGGKAALLSAYAARRGARVVAADRSAHRARLVAGAVAPDPGTAVLVADATAPAWRAGSFDRVLLDAPCTGLGALRRRPESRWRRQPGDADRLHVLQVDLLRSAAVLTRPGGVLAYVTCSPDRRETESVVRAVLAHGGLEPVPVPLPVGLSPAGPQAIGVQMWPQRHETDAMYVCVLRRTQGF